LGSRLCGSRPRFKAQDLSQDIASQDIASQDIASQDVASAVN
jgi:hypothetical protein